MIKKYNKVREMQNVYEVFFPFLFFISKAEYEKKRPELFFMFFLK